MIHHDVLAYMSEEMKRRGIKHATSECTLRGFTGAVANVDPKTATSAEIVKIRQIKTGYVVDGLTGGPVIARKVKIRMQPEHKVF